MKLYTDDELKKLSINELIDYIWAMQAKLLECGAENIELTKKIKEDVSK